MRDVTKRFSDRVENFQKYRPSYPPELIITLQSNNVINSDSVIADIGSGTGIFTQLLVDTGCKIYGIEPNKEMREAAERTIGQYVNFTSIDGQAEDTTLDDNTVDVITVAQAFHWFNLEKTRKEFSRILKPNGYVVLIWNDRIVEKIPFQFEYNQLIKNYCPDYGKSTHTNITKDQLKEFYGSPKISNYSCKNYQYFDQVSLQGRLESSSYCIKPTHQDYTILMDSLEKLFSKYKKDNQVTFEYNTRMYYGKIV